MRNQDGRHHKGEVQVIGDRVVINPRTRICHQHDAEGNVVETIRLSLEVCGCGYSLARPGVGYAGADGWYCKRCGQLHTRDATQAGSVNVEAGDLKPDPERVRQFDMGMKVSAEWSTPSDLEAAR